MYKGMSQKELQGEIVNEFPTLQHPEPYNQLAVIEEEIAANLLDKELPSNELEGE